MKGKSSKKAAESAHKGCKSRKEAAETAIRSSRSSKKAAELAKLGSRSSKRHQTQQNQDRRYEICFKMDAKAEVMSHRASKVGHFPLSRQNILLFAQHKAEMPLEKWWFLGQFGYGKIFLHTIFANIVLRKCDSYRGRRAHFHNICKKIKKNHANKHQTSIVLKEITEIAKMNRKS